MKKCLALIFIISNVAYSMEANLELASLKTTPIDAEGAKKSEPQALIVNASSVLAASASKADQKQAQQKAADAEALRAALARARSVSPVDPCSLNDCGHCSGCCRSASPSAGAALLLSEGVNWAARRPFQRRHTKIFAPLAAPLTVHQLESCPS